jgi:CheY-like chemotaxis protein
MSRILVVDDDPIIRQICKSYFTSKGHDVAVAKDGAEGIKVFKTKDFDVVVTDLMMPNGHGFQVIDAIKLSARGAKTGVLLLSADVNDPDLKAYERRAFQDDTLSKPFDVPDLEKKINDLIVEMKNRE